MNMQNANFIYVFNRVDMERLLSLGFNLIQSNENLGIYIFDSKCKKDFSFSNINGMNYVLTDTLTF